MSFSDACVRKGFVLSVAEDGGISYLMEELETVSSEGDRNQCGDPTGIKITFINLDRMTVQCP